MPFAQTAMRFLDIGYHDYEGIAIEMTSSSAWCATWQPRAMILRNHGLLVVGGSIPQAGQHLPSRARCQLQVATLSCNTRSRCRRQGRRGASHSTSLACAASSHPRWPALIRKLTRSTLVPE